MSNTIKRAKARAEQLQLTTTETTTTDNKKLLFISLENIIDGSAIKIDRKIESELFKYLKRAKINFEDRGYYSAIAIIE